MKNKFRIIVRRFALVVVFVLIVAASIVGAKRVLNFFQIKDIVVSGDAAAVEINEQLFVGNLLFFPVDASIRQIQQDNPLVKSVQIKRSFPSTLELIVEKRQPIARIISGAIQLGVDETGMVIGSEMTSGLPSLFFDGPLVRIGRQITDVRIRTALNLIDGSKSVITWSTVVPYESESLRARFGQTDILITQYADVIQTLSTLQTLVAGFRIKGSMPKTIDLRFTKPVVQF